MKLRLKFLFLMLSLVLVSCGGGIGAGAVIPGIACAISDDCESSSSSPAIIINNNLGNYQQGESLRISFTTRGLDEKSVSYTVAEYDKDDFRLDATEGVFRSVTWEDEEEDGEWLNKDYLTLPAGQHSFTVTATDANGKSASRSFQFNVDSVRTGFYVATEPSPYSGNTFRELEIDISRDGFVNLATFTYSGSTDDLLNGNPLGSKNLMCFGDSDVHGRLVTGALQCGGQLPRSINDSGYYWGSYPIQLSTDFASVANIEFELEFSKYGEQFQGEFRFYDSDGGLEETWTDSEGYDYDSAGPWIDNHKLVGRYMVLFIYSQYSIDNIYRDWDIFHTVQDGKYILDITPEFTFSSPSAQSCQFYGGLSETSLQELDKVLGGEEAEYFYYNRQRIMSAEYSTSGCDAIIPMLGLSEGESELFISQSVGPATVTPFLASESDWLLFGEGAPIGNDDSDEIGMILVAGAGENKPFRFIATKICDSEGEPTNFNNFSAGSLCDR